MRQIRHSTAAVKGELPDAFLTQQHCVAVARRRSLTAPPLRCDDSYYEYAEGVGRTLLERPHVKRIIQLRKDAVSILIGSYSQGWIVGKVKEVLL